MTRASTGATRRRGAAGIGAASRGCCGSIVACVLTLVVVPTTTLAGGVDTLTYTLMPQPETGGLRVELAWETHERKLSVLGVSPHFGSIADVPALLSGVNIDGGQSVRRDGHRWFVDHAPGATLNVTYQVNPGRTKFDWDSTFYPITTKTLFHGIGNVFLLAPEPGGNVPREYQVLLRWKLPAKWKAVCSWGVGRSVGEKLLASDLRHSVYLAGEFETKSEEKNGRRVTVAMPPAFEFSPDEFLAMSAKIIGDQCDFMGDREFPPFIVTAIPVGEPLKEGDSRLSGSGLYNSFALWVAPQAKLNDAVEHLFAHELFHYWNGRLLETAQPEELVYWFTEGVTDYYALRLLYASGRWKVNDYAKWLNRHLREYVANPAINATNEEIKAGFWKQRNTVGEVAYQRGLILMLRWDKIARDKGIKEGVDKLFKTLVSRARTGGHELSNEGIRAAGAELLGDWFGPEFDRYVFRAETVAPQKDALLPNLNGEEERVYDYDLGFDREKSLSNKRIVGLKDGSSAAKAGLKNGDKLLGWNIYGEADLYTELRIMTEEAEKKTIRYQPRGTPRDVMQYHPVVKKTRP